MSGLSSASRCPLYSDIMAILIRKIRQDHVRKGYAKGCIERININSIYSEVGT